jgi:hypothetical protein
MHAALRCLWVNADRAGRQLVEQFLDKYQLTPEEVFLLWWV